MPASCAKALRPGHRLVGLHRHARDLAQHLAGGEQLLADDPGVVGIPVGPHSHGHHNFFERSVACALSDAVDGALHLARAGGDRGQRIGDRQSQIVVTVRRDDHLLDAAHALSNALDQLAKLRRHAVADRVRDIQGRGAGFDHRIEHLVQEFVVGAGGVLGRKFHVGAQRFGQADRIARLLQALLRVRS